MMQKTKLIQLGKYYHPEPGGMETHLYDHCCELRDKFDIQVLVANTKPRTVTEMVDGVRVTRVANWGEVFSSPMCPTFPRHLSRINSSAGSIIQLHLPNPLAHFSYLLAKPPGRLVLVWHSDIIKQRWMSRFYNKHLYELLARADCVVATSPNYAKYSPFLRRYADKTVVVPLGIRAERFESSTQTRQQAQWIRQEYGEPMVLFVGRLTYYKGLENLIQAAEKISGKIAIIGNGPLKNQLEQTIRGRGLQGKVFLLQNVSNDDLVSFYHACDVFVLPSNKRSEAFGVVQLEAMVSGKPVVSTNLNTGVPWVNQNGQTGLVVPVNHPEKLAQAINYLLENHEKSRRFGRNARQRVLENFTIEKVTGRMERVYDKILNGGLQKERAAAVIYE